MKRALLAFIAVLLSSAPSLAEASCKAVKLLDGYQCQEQWAVDATTWDIKGKNGLVIHFEVGYNEGLAANPAKKEQYEWFREQRVNGKQVLIALTKPGLKTVWDADESDNQRHLAAGRVLLVSFPIAGSHEHVANFVAKVANEEELVDALLMALTFDPK